MVIINQNNENQLLTLNIMAIAFSLGVAFPFSIPVVHVLL